ncbi:MAG: cation transporter [Lentisphaerae bacterium]|nr:cation transporter [Lentisphaerota bacterium]
MTTRPHYSIRQVTLVGLLVNVALCAIKFVAGTLGHSRAVVADAVHSLTDLSTDIAVIAGSMIWDKPPDSSHPYGHRRFETLVALFVGGVLLLAGLGLGWNALVALQTPRAQAPGMIAFLAALVSIVVKEILYRWTAHSGKRLGSIALEANARHHRSDALSSIPVALAVAGARLIPSWTFLDHAGALVVCVFIVYSAWKIMGPGLAELTDSAAPESIRRKITAIAESIPDVHEVHNVRTRYVAARLQIDLHVLVAPTMSVARSHDIAVNVQNLLIEQGPNVLDVIVHIEPYDPAHSKR